MYAVTVDFHKCSSLSPRLWKFNHYLETFIYNITILILTLTILLTVFPHRLHASPYLIVGRSGNIARLGVRTNSYTKHNLNVGSHKLVKDIA